MSALYLADLSGHTEKEVKNHIAMEYSGGNDYFPLPSKYDAESLAAELENYDILVAYESVGDFGCDSSSWFLLRRKDTGGLFEFSGSHCSCYGFEGQFDLEETSFDYLKSDKFYFCSGGYDDNETENQRLVREYLAAI